MSEITFEPYVFARLRFRRIIYLNKVHKQAIRKETEIMKKRLLSILLIFCMVLTMIPVGGVFAADDTTVTNEKEIEGVKYKLNADETATVIANIPKYEGEITIPSEVTDTESDVTYAVTSIGNGAFNGCSALKSIEIPNSVTSIGNSAFYECAELEKITFADGCTGLTSIGESAFYECKKLGSIEIPNNVTSIGDSTFYKCKKLKSIKIPDSVTSIGKEAFYMCSALESITIPNNVTSIGASVFDGCSGLTSITIPNNVTIIGVRAFSDCKGLTSITIPARVASIGNYAFEKCTDLKEINVDENNSKYSSADGVLFNKDNEEKTLTAYPAGKTGVYKIPTDVTNIGIGAFSGCTGLKSIEIPNNVNRIEVNVFQGCSSLESITFASGSLLTSIGNGAFNGCSALKSIEIPNNVTVIGNNAFSKCAIKDATTGSITGLTSITFEPDSELTSIEAEAFFECSALKSIEIPNSVTSIGNSAFSACKGLTSITIPDNVNSIGNGAFYGCSKLTTVIYGDKSNWDNNLNGRFPNGTTFIFLKTKPEFGVNNITSNSVTLNEITGDTDNPGENFTVQYRVKKDNINTDDGWQDESKIEGLNPDTEYTFQVGFFDNVNTEPAVYELAPVRTAKKTPSYTPPANPTIDITGKEGGTVIYDRIKHTVTITPNDNYLVKEITINGTTIPVTDGAMVLENIYGWSRIAVTFEPKPEPAFEPDKYISELKFKANSSKTSKGNIRIKVTSVTDDNGNKIDLTELKDKGYTVKFKYYRSTKKASKYTAKVEKDADINSYINTVGKKGTKYYYKVRVMVYDADGNLVAKSDLKQCSYAARTWSK